MTPNRLTNLLPVKFTDKDGKETFYNSAIDAAKGNSSVAAKISASIRTHRVEEDGSRWEWATIDRKRLERILEIATEMGDEEELLKAISGDKSNTVRYKPLPDDLDELLYFDKVWKKNRWWQPRIKALKKTYYRPVQMIDAETGEVVKEYQSSKQCCEENGFRKGDISLILSGKRRLKSINGYTFEYKKIKDRKRRDKELKEWKKGNRKQWKMKN